jgi:hypothetical protein
MMNGEVHIVPIGLNSWAVEVGKTSYKAFESEEKALEFGQKMAAREHGCKIYFHDRNGNTVSVEENQTRH